MEIMRRNVDISVFFFFLLSILAARNLKQGVDVYVWDSKSSEKLVR